jgi:hypothetical protein
MAYQHSKAHRVLAIAAILILLALPFGCMAGGAYTETYPRPFNASAWKAAANLNDESRCGMLADLRARVGVAGKTQAELSKLLGEPQPYAWEPASSYWPLCNSFTDVWILRVQWQSGRAKSVMVHDT